MTGPNERRQPLIGHRFYRRVEAERPFKQLFDVYLS
jgi:hypothetical protein